MPPASTDWTSPPKAVTAVVVTGLGWMTALVVLAGTPAAQHLSNVGLVLVAAAAGIAALLRARRHDGSIRRFWALLGTGILAWALGQCVWTWFESVLGQAVPFPSLADWGYLGLPMLAAAALLSLPLAAPTIAGRVRTLLDGLMVAGSFLLVSWIVVLGAVIDAAQGIGLAQVISLAYPVGDIVLMTIVLYTWSRARQLQRRLPVSLPLVGAGLLAFAVADSGFTYLTTAGLYSSGNYIDFGWFTGFALLLLAALATPSDQAQSDEQAGVRSLGNLLPYTAVTAGVVVSAIEFGRTGISDGIVSWTRTAIMTLLVLRQVLTLLENSSLTRNLEQRVVERTAELRASHLRFSALVQHSSDVVTVVDRQGVVTYQSQSSHRILGYAYSELLGRPILDLMDPRESAELVAILELAARGRLRVHTLHSTWRHADGRPCRVEVTVTNLLDNPDVNGLVLNTRDVTDRTALEEQLTEQAFTDSLTQLPNRALFKDRLQHALERRVTVEGRVSVLYLDLDGFKAVNDTFGHSTGDQLLIQVAHRLRAAVRPSDTVARLGGDEFAVLVDDFSELVQETDLAERICSMLKEPFQLEAEQVHVATSVGIARADTDSPDAEQLLRNADLAMYQAKSAGGGGHVVYHPEMHAGLLDRVRLESDLRKAIENDELMVLYQPLVSLRTGLITGVEALVRWQHPQRGLIGPTEFIPLAESTGLIYDIGLWVLRQACAQTVRWGELSLSSAETLSVSVNISGRQLLQGDLPASVGQCLVETGLPGNRLTLEMTESVLMDDRDQTLESLTTLRAMGVRIAIDDFGTGYSSLSYLHQFPVDVLKIDRSFVQRLVTDGESALVSTIVRLGQTMHLETVAEGIEDSQQMLMLRRLGCTTAQGYYFSRPVSADELAGLLAEQDVANRADAEPLRV